MPRATKADWEDEVHRLRGVLHEERLKVAHLKLRVQALQTEVFLVEGKSPALQEYRARFKDLLQDQEPTSQPSSR
jgi:hypothetical protein